MTAEELSRSFDVLYSKMTPRKKADIYHNNYDQAKEYILDMYELGMETEKDSKWEKCGLEVSESVYAAVWSRLFAGFIEISDIHRSLASHFQDIKELTLENLIIYSYMKQKHPSVLSELTKKMVVKKPEDVPEAEKKYLNDRKYGLVPEKPVYVNGFEGQHLYLGKLRTKKGKRLTFRRLGSTRAAGVDGVVDIYSAITDDVFHRQYGKIYLCIYGTTNSDRAPHGYTLLT